jgi:hypothetical protein
LGVRAHHPEWIRVPPDEPAGFRVSQLEGAAGGPVITGLFPSNFPIPTNSILTIVGSGFDREPNRNKVILGSRTITEFREGSDQTLLSFTVPDVFSDLPKQVDAVVETGGDPGHAPARAAYEAAGFALLPTARSFRRLD